MKRKMQALAFVGRWGGFTRIGSDDTLAATSGRAKKPSASSIPDNAKLVKPAPNCAKKSRREAFFSEAGSGGIPEEFSVDIGHFVEVEQEEAGTLESPVTGPIVREFRPEGPGHTAQRRPTELVEADTRTPGADTQTSGSRPSRSGYGLQCRCGFVAQKNSQTIPFKADADGQSIAPEENTAAGGNRDSRGSAQLTHHEAALPWLKNQLQPALGGLARLN